MTNMDSTSKTKPFFGHYIKSMTEAVENGVIIDRDFLSQFVVS
jgi:hypothetical protein